MSPSLCRVILLADRPELADHWAALHWREWGGEPGREELAWWVADARKATNRTSIPAAFLAVAPDDAVLGGVGLHQFDPEERCDRSPWIVGMVVRADRRGEGIGQVLIAALEAWAGDLGIERLWVATETAGRAVAFYEKCGYDPVEELTAGRGEVVTMLTKALVPTST